MTLTNTIIVTLCFGNALYLAYLLGEMREARRQTAIQDRLAEKLVAAYQQQR